MSSRLDAVAKRGPALGSVGSAGVCLGRRSDRHIDSLPTLKPRRFDVDRRLAASDWTVGGVRSPARAAPRSRTGSAGYRDALRLRLASGRACGTMRAFEGAAIDQRGVDVASHDNLHSSSGAAPDHRRRARPRDARRQCPAESARPRHGVAGARRMVVRRLRHLHLGSPKGQPPRAADDARRLPVAARADDDAGRASVVYIVGLWLTDLWAPAFALFLLSFPTGPEVGRPEVPQCRRPDARPASASVRAATRKPTRSMRGPRRLAPSASPGNERPSGQSACNTRQADSAGHCQRASRGRARLR